MIIGLDLDGTTVKYNAALADHIIKQLGLVLTPEERALAFPDPDTYNFTNWKYVPDFAAFKKFHTQAVEDGIYRDLQLIEGADEFLWKLSEAGHHIRVITSRFVKGGQHQKVVTDTSYSLENLHIPYKDLMFTARKTDIFADVYVDDSPDNILSFQRANRPYIIFDQVYNRDLEGPRVTNWADAYKLILDMASQA